MTATYNFERISLLIADPSKYMRSLLVGLARSYGFRTVYEATDGSAALNHMRERHVDLVLTEGPMNPMDGFEFTRLTIGASDFSRRHYSLDDMPPGQTDPELRHFSLDPERADVIPAVKQALEVNHKFATGQFSGSGTSISMEA